MNKKNIFYIIILTEMGFFICLGLFLFLDSIHWTKKQINKNEIILLKDKLYKFEEGIEIATVYAKRINENLKLYDIELVILDKKEIKNRTGKIKYSFFAKNNDIFGYSGLYFYLVIDLERQSIIDMELEGSSKKIFLEPIYIDPKLFFGKIDLPDIYDILNRREIYTIIKEVDNFYYIQIYPEITDWVVVIYSKKGNDVPKEEIFIRIDKQDKSYRIIKN